MDLDDYRTMGNAKLTVMMDVVLTELGRAVIQGFNDKYIMAQCNRCNRFGIISWSLYANEKTRNVLCIRFVDGVQCIGRLIPLTPKPTVKPIASGFSSGI